MIVQVKCEHCGNDFESEGMERTEFCPHCGKETVVTNRIATPPVQPAKSKLPAQLHACLDCGHQISPRAFFCPHCGALPHVPFRIIWGVTCGVLFALFLMGIIGAVIGWLIEAVKDAAQ